MVNETLLCDVVLIKKTYDTLTLKKHPNLFYHFSSAPTGPPLDVSGHNLTETSIQTSWKEIVEGDRNGVITHYKIKYKNVRTEVSAEKEVGAILTAQITGEILEIIWLQFLNSSQKSRKNWNFSNSTPPPPLIPYN